MMKIKVFFAWYDFWIGAYYNQLSATLFICPIPMLCIRIRLPIKGKDWR